MSSADALAALEKLTNILKKNERLFVDKGAKMLREWIRDAMNFENRGFVIKKVFELICADKFL